MTLNCTMILDLLVKYNNNKTKVAADLDINRPNLYRYLRKMRELGMIDNDFNAIIDENDTNCIEEYNNILPESYILFITDLIKYDSMSEKGPLTSKLELYGEDRVIERDGVVEYYSIEDDDHTKTIEELDIEYEYFGC